MSSDTSYLTLKRKFESHIDEIIKEKREALTSGNASDFAMYKNECGLINGLIQSKKELHIVITTLLKGLDEDDDI